jgi:uncharacterized repeat protein (TIGR01451 family)
VRGKALLVGSLLVGAAVAASSDATASAPAISITTTPTVQNVATRVVERFDAKTGKREASLLFGTATFTVTVANPGDVELDGVSVLDQAAPGCNRTLGALAAGASVSYSCQAPNVGRNLTNRMTVSGSTQDGSRTLATATAAVKVRKPHQHRGRSKIHFLVPLTG